MHLIVAATRDVVHFAPVKAVLHALEYQPQTQREKMVLRVLMPDDTAIAMARQSASLTEMTDYDQQIRFFSRQRIIRDLTALSDYLYARYGRLQITVVEAEHLDSASRLFFETISRRANAADVSLVYGCPADCSPIRYRLSPREAQIEELVTIHTSYDNEIRSLLTQEAQRYINCGDAWTASRILWRLICDRTTPQLESMMGLAHQLQENRTEAEFYYNRWANSGLPLDRARANYVLAMLYARHHAEALQSLEKAASYLNEAYTLLQELANDPHQKQSQILFETVFNRNGYALILFRQKQVPQAMELLQWGLEVLRSEHAGMHLHKTVLMYNLAQCYVQLDRMDDAITVYQELLELDPKFPEYHLELARCFIFKQDYIAALRTLEYACTLNASILEAWALIGLCHRELGNLEACAENYGRAWRMEPFRSDLSYDYAYSLAEAQRYEECQAILERIDLKRASSGIQKDILSLLAEAYFNQNNSHHAIAVLQRGLKLVPGSTKLLDNLVLIQQHLSQQEGVKV